MIASLHCWQSLGRSFSSVFLQGRLLHLQNTALTLSIVSIQYQPSMGRFFCQHHLRQLQTELTMDLAAFLVQAGTPPPLSEKRDKPASSADHDVHDRNVRKKLDFSWAADGGQASHGADTPASCEKEPS